MSIHTKFVCHELVELGIIFLIDSFVKCFVVFLVELFTSLGHKTYKDMGEKKTFGNKVWWADAFASITSHET